MRQIQSCGRSVCTRADPPWGARRLFSRAGHARVVGCLHLGPTQHEVLPAQDTKAQLQQAIDGLIWATATGGPVLNGMAPILAASTVIAEKSAAPAPRLLERQNLIVVESHGPNRLRFGRLRQSAEGGRLLESLLESLRGSLRESLRGRGRPGWGLSPGPRGPGRSCAPWGGRPPLPGGG